MQYLQEKAFLPGSSPPYICYESPAVLQRSLSFTLRPFLPISHFWAASATLYPPAMVGRFYWLTLAQPEKVDHSYKPAPTHPSTPTSDDKLLLQTNASLFP